MRTILMFFSTCYPVYLLSGTVISTSYVLQLRDDR
jgi:hypothetical protein